MSTFSVLPPARPARLGSMPFVRATVVIALLVVSTATARAQGPGQVRDLIGVVARNTVALSWQAPSAPPAPILGYQLDVGLSPGATLVSLPLGNVLTFSAVAPEGVFFVRAQALTASGPTGPSNEIRLVTGQAGSPEAPLSLLSRVAGGNVALQWTENPVGPVVASYVLEAGTGPGLANVVSAGLPATARSLATPAPPGTYYVRIRAANAAGIGPPSNEVIVVSEGVVCAVPGPPGGLMATTAPGGVALSWNPPPTGGIPAGYRLDAGTSPGTTNVGSFPLPLMTTIATGAPAGTYFVRVVATNNCGASAPSNQVSFTVTPPQPTSLIGMWDGVVFNHPGSFGNGPITNFLMTITREPVRNSFTPGGTWRDNLGCQSNNVVPFISGSGAGTVGISVESLRCNDGDFTMTITSIVGNVVQGTCRGNCRFRMTKR